MIFEMGKLIHHFDHHLAGDHVPFLTISPLKKPADSAGLK
jgi:hypothetical protein